MELGKLGELGNSGIGEPGKLIELPRTAVSYLWEGLFPGRSYFLKVQARNEVSMVSNTTANTLEIR
jgi:hypothetical protein